MKKLLIGLVFIIAFTTSPTYGQTTKPAVNQQIVVPRNDDAVFQLFQTQNIWTFIKLNTRNGQMWQVQWNSKESLRHVTYLNPSPLVPLESEKNGRFTLYPTQNIYNYILLDQITGETWQVQWSTIPEERATIPIE